MIFEDLKFNKFWQLYQTSISNLILLDYCFYQSLLNIRTLQKRLKNSPTRMTFKYSHDEQERREPKLIFLAHSSSPCTQILAWLSIRFSMLPNLTNQYISYSMAVFSANEIRTLFISHLTLYIFTRFFARKYIHNGNGNEWSLTVDTLQKKNSKWMTSSRVSWENELKCPIQYFNVFMFHSLL